MHIEIEVVIECYFNPQNINFYVDDCLPKKIDKNKAIYDSADQKTMQARALAKQQQNWTKRIMIELEKLNKESNIKAILKNADKLDTILVLLTPPADRPFRNQKHVLELQLVSKDGKKRYPINPPTVVFRTKIFHPNIGGYNVDHAASVDKQEGYSVICLDILKEEDKWVASNSLVTVVMNIIYLMDEPNPNSPLNGEAARLWMDAEKQYCNLNQKSELLKEECFAQYQKKAWNFYISANAYQKKCIDMFNT